MKLTTEAKVTLTKADIQEAIDTYLTARGIKRTSPISFQSKIVINEPKAKNMTLPQMVAGIEEVVMCITKGCIFTAVIAEKKVSKVAEIKKEKLDDKSAGKDKKGK